MIIVSQDKERIVNFEKVEILGIDSDNKLEIACDFNEGSMVLGTYKTEERAKEVLQDIADIYSKIGITFDTYNGGQVQQLPVYEMPEE